jgi:hypothetical protein
MLVTCSIESFLDISQDLWPLSLDKLFILYKGIGNEGELQIKKYNLSI